jgi:hypothetical protein
MVIVFIVVSLVDVRDAFEPEGSNSICAILRNEISKDSSDLAVMEACFSLTRVVTKSEDTKGIRLYPSILAVSL